MNEIREGVKELKKKKVITYGTFDMFHIGHLRLLERCKKLGDHLTVFISTDEFNLKKGKKSVISYEDRAEIVRSIKFVDEVFPENSWDQKKEDIITLNIDTFVMGDDWSGKFDYLEELCDVVYLERTANISTTMLKTDLQKNDY